MGKLGAASSESRWSGFVSRASIGVRSIRETSPALVGNEEGASEALGAPRP